MPSNPSLVARSRHALELTSLALVLAIGTSAGCADQEQPSSSPGAGAGAGQGGSAGNSGTAGGAGAGGTSATGFGKPPWFPDPVYPADNPQTAEKVDLGRYLFYDKRLSGNQTQACASCHKQESAFTDGRGTGLGSTGEAHVRGPQSLVNVAYSSVLTWANPLQIDLENQALVPLFGEHPIELGLSGKEDELLQRLRDEPRYSPLFSAAFPEASDPYSIASVAAALSCFERSIIGGRSPYDLHAQGLPSPEYSDSAARGEALFFSERLECYHCHGGFTFSDSVKSANKPFAETFFHNTGLYNIDLVGGYPEGNRGVYEITGKASDMGKFRTPTLRNIAITAPYMHDGSIATLDGVIDHYAAAGRTIESGPNAGVGSANPYKSPLVLGFTLNAQEREDLKAFLNSLTDHGVLTDPSLGDPW